MIRPASIDDAQQIARLTGELGYPVEAEVMAARLIALAAEPRQRVWVIARHGRIDGWIAAERRLSLDAGERVEITALVVDTAARRGGVGAALVARAEAWALGEGLSTTVVRSNVQRVASHPFYESLGYVRKKSQHVYSKELAR